MSINLNLNKIWNDFLFSWDNKNIFPSEVYFNIFGKSNQLNYSSLSSSSSLLLSSTSTTPISTTPISTTPISTTPISTTPISTNPISTNPISTTPPLASTIPSSSSTILYHGTQDTCSALTCNQCSGCIIMRNGLQLSLDGSIKSKSNFSKGIRLASNSSVAHEYTSVNKDGYRCLFIYIANLDSSNEDNNNISDYNSNSSNNNSNNINNNNNTKQNNLSDYNSKLSVNNEYHSGYGFSTYGDGSDGDRDSKLQIDMYDDKKYLAYYQNQVVPIMAIIYRTDIISNLNFNNYSIIFLGSYQTFEYSEKKPNYYFKLL